MLPQAHKFLTGYAPIRSMARVGAAAGALLAIPAEQLAPGAQPRVNAPPLSRQLQRGLTSAFPAGPQAACICSIMWLCLRLYCFLDYQSVLAPVLALCGNRPVREG